MKTQAKNYCNNIEIAMHLLLAHTLYELNLIYVPPIELLAAMKIKIILNM